MTFLYCALALIAEIVLCCMIIRIEKAIYSHSERADAAASGGVRSKPLLAGERSVARGKGETGGQAPCVSGTRFASSR